MFAWGGTHVSKRGLYVKPPTEGKATLMLVPRTSPDSEANRSTWLPFQTGLTSMKRMGRWSVYGVPRRMTAPAMCQPLLQVGPLAFFVQIRPASP